MTMRRFSMSTARHLLSVTLPPLLLATLSATACHRAAGPTLGLFIGLLVTATLLVPPLTAAERRWQDRLLVLAATLLPLSVCWAIASRQNDSRLGEWLAATLVLTTYALALVGLSAAPSVTVIGRIPAVAI